MNNEKMTKKELANAYKQREVIGGVFAIRNTINGKAMLDASTNLQGQKNRFDFAKSTNSCVHKKLDRDWKEYGADVFVFEILEELKKGETQTEKEFADDVKLLKEIWLEKAEGIARY